MFVEPLESRCLLAFGLTATSGVYTVDTGAGVEFSVLRSGSSSTIHAGDLSSFKRNGVEFAAPYNEPFRYSHFESGLGNGTTIVTATTDPAGQWIKITADDRAPGGTGVIQYYLAKRHDPAIYMATFAPELRVSSTRFITYLDWDKFPNHPPESDTSNAVQTIESGDVFANADGTTRSKYYAENRLVNQVYHGATGPGVGAFMFIGSRESGSGGPFWKDIDFQSTGAAVEVYNIPFSDHSQTELFRPGLHGPYALVLTGGGQPTQTPDYTFLEGANIVGLVPESGRGTLNGTISGIPAGRVPTVGLANSTAQYWTTPAANGSYTIDNIKPGTYTQTLYDEELEVGARTVTITAGRTTAADIANTYYLPAPVFRIGTWDGTPREFLNGDRITDMHPSDPRITPFVDTNFTIGAPDNQWPLGMWKDASLNDYNQITFNLTAAQAATNMTFRIGITRAQTGGRPIIRVNNGNFSAVPFISNQPGTRGITLGSWRGNNTTYTYNINANQLNAGTNTIGIAVASGSSSGSPWLQPQITFDALDLVPTASLTNAPRVSSIAVTPMNPNVGPGATQTFTASARDQFGQPIPANVEWSATRGTIDATGTYIAPATAGSDTVRATANGITGTTTVNVVGALQVTSARFDYEQAQAIVLTFNRSVDPTRLTSALRLRNLTTGTDVPQSALNLNYIDMTGTFTFNAVLPKGDYRATLPSNLALTASSETLGSTTYTLDFFVLTGDLDRDRDVDLFDAALLERNFGRTDNPPFSRGDIDYDGDVDLFDAALLERNFGTTLSSPATGTVRAAPHPPRLVALPQLRPPLFSNRSIGGGVFGGSEDDLVGPAGGFASHRGLPS